MSGKTIVEVPDLGGADQVEVIEIMVAIGDVIEPEQGIINVEGDKASMDVPSPLPGKVVGILVQVGDKISEGAPVIEIETGEKTESVDRESNQSTVDEENSAENNSTPSSNSAASADTIAQLLVPDMGGADQVEIIEMHIAVGDIIDAEDAIVTLESDKASMDVPASYGGKITAVHVAIGDKVNEGSLLAEIAVIDDANETQPSSAPSTNKASEAVSAPNQPTSQASTNRATSVQKASGPVQSYQDVHAGPAVRRFGRELGVDLTQVLGSGAKGRIVTDNVKSYVRETLSQPRGSASATATPAPASVDFSQFGEIEVLPFSKIKRLTGQHMSHCWSTIPHVTQFGEADITEMEAFRQAHKNEAMDKGIRLTPLAFIMQVLAQTMQEFPHFNASLDPSGESLILKKYCHIGMAVETPAGLVVPVIRDVVGQSLLELAEAMGKISKKARETGLAPAEMKGGCMTISSLGGIGGTAFTPIVNSPEVAILGVSKSYMKPVYLDGEFVPRLMLPLSLSYDHRVIDGAEGARFLTRFSELLSDIRNLLL